MLARHAFVSALLALLAACSSMSEVTPAGQNRYRITSSSGMQWLTWVEIKNQTLQSAHQYCQSIGRKLQKPAIRSNHATGLGAKRVTVTFECGDIAPSRNAQPSSGDVP